VNHSMQFIRAMTDAGRDVETRIFPPGRHGAAYNLASRNVMYQAMDEFLARYLLERSREMTP